VFSLLADLPPLTVSHPPGADSHTSPVAPEWLAGGNNQAERKLDYDAGRGIPGQHGNALMAQKTIHCQGQNLAVRFSMFGNQDITRRRQMKLSPTLSTPRSIDGHLVIALTVLCSFAQIYA